jgi:hypothetical protein
MPRQISSIAGLLRASVFECLCKRWLSAWVMYFRIGSELVGRIQPDMPRQQQVAVVMAAAATDDRRPEHRGRRRHAKRRARTRLHRPMMMKAFGRAPPDRQCDWRSE